MLLIIFKCLERSFNAKLFGFLEGEVRLDLIYSLDRHLKGVAIFLPKLFCDYKIQWLFSMLTGKKTNSNLKESLFSAKYYAIFNLLLHRINLKEAILIIYYYYVKNFK